MGVLVEQSLHEKSKILFFKKPHSLTLSFYLILLVSDDEFNTENFSRFKQDKQAAQKAAQQAALQNDPELAAILTETRQVQQDTLQSSRNAVKTLQETIVVADKTNAELKSQGEQLKKIGATAEQADEHAQESYDKARELHKYKGFLPFSVKQWFTGGKKKSADAEYLDKQKSLDKTAEKLAKQQAKAGGAVAGVAGAQGLARDPTGDAVEDEIDQNLDEMSRGLDHLKSVGQDMQGEIARQNMDVEHIKATTEHTDYTLNSANRKIQDFMWIKGDLDDR